MLDRAALHSVDGASAAEMAQGCALFDVVGEGGQLLGAFALRVDQFASGRTVSVTAAGALGDNGATEAMHAWAEQQAREHIGANTLTCTTQRPGLVRKLQRLGYRVAGYVMTKEL